METISFTIRGLDSLLMNNPQCVDPFNHYTKAKKVITGKRVKTDEDQLELRRLDVESKLYFDDELGIYVPVSWILASIAKVSFTRAKIAKGLVRSTVFPTENRIKLHYRDMDKVTGLADISGNTELFTHTALLKQGQIKVAKASPIFHDWHFSTTIEFDPDFIDRSTLVGLLKYAAQYGGYGDFRPTFGRSLFEETAALSAAA